MQSSSEQPLEGRSLRDDPHNGCEGDCLSVRSLANAVPPRILRSRISRKKNTREILLHGHNNLACWIINLLLNVLLCIKSAIDQCM